MKKAKNKNIFVILLGGIMVIYSISLLIPIFWILMTSLKSYEEYTILENLIGLPTKLQFSEIIANYKTAWGESYASGVVDGEMMYYPIMTQLMNSILYAVGSTVTATLVPFCTAYVTARHRYKFSNVLYAIVIAAMVIPVFGNQASSIEMMRTLGLYDHIWGFWISKASFLGTYFLIFYAQFKSISFEYTEAARIDGASHFATMTKIIMPLARGTFFTVALLTFVGFWNNYQDSMLYNPSNPTLGYGMYQFSVKGGHILASVPIRIAYMVIVTIPILTLFILTHKRLMEGNLSIGGIKG